MDNNKSTENAETSDGRLSVDAHVINILLKEWKVEEDEMYKKIQFLREHNFKHEENYLKELREALQERRFRLMMVTNL